MSGAAAVAVTLCVLAGLAGPMQAAVMEKLQQQMITNIQSVSPEALMHSWFTFDPKLAERFQDMFATMAGLGGRRPDDKKK